MMKHGIFLMILLMFGTLNMIAQDMILKRNDEIIKCKVKEVGLDEVKYSLPDYPSDVMFVVAKDDITRIIFEDGRELTFEKRMTNPDNYAENRKNAIKVDFLSPATGNTTFSYERSLRPSRSVEASLGIIGLGVDNADRNPGGFFMKFGYKFIKDPDFYIRGMQYAHLLKGSYVKPEIAFGYMKRDYYVWEDSWDANGNWIGREYNDRREAFSGTIQLVLGKQWVFDNFFLIDLYGGVGYGFYTDDEAGYYYGYTIADESFPVSVSAGLKIGFLMK